MFAAAMLLGALLGLGAGAALAWMLARAQGARDLAAAKSFAAVELATAQIRLEERDRESFARGQERDAAIAERDEARAAHAAAREDLARMQAQATEERKAAAEKLALVEQAEASLREAFEALSSDALRRNNQSFIELARETLGAFQKEAAGDLERRQQAIGAIVQPIRESLAKVDEKIRDIETSRVEAYTALHEQVGSLVETQQQLQSETSNLVKALRTPNVRGRWGEVQLRRVVEMAGMMEHCDFLEQRTATTEEGRFRPDLVVRLPGGRCVVVDAKTPLDAFLSAVEATDDVRRAELLRQHTKQVREHVAKLSSKQYWGQFQTSPDFVFMFLPGETFLAAALQQDPALLEHAVEQRVILASPTTLITLLQTVAYGWRQEQVERNAQIISDLGRALYERLATMAGHFDDLRRNLDGAVESYNKTVGSLETRVLVGARRFSELGVVTQKEIPELATVDRSARALTALPLLDEPEGDADTPPAFLSVESG